MTTMPDYIRRDLLRRAKQHYRRACKHFRNAVNMRLISARNAQSMVLWSYRLGVVRDRIIELEALP